MLPRAERLTTIEFARVFERGRAFRTTLIQARVLRRADGADANATTCAAFVAGKKLGKATVRNSLRRRVREVYRLSAWRSDERLAGCDLVFLIAPLALNANREDLIHALDEVLEKAARSMR